MDCKTTNKNRLHMRRYNKSCPCSKTPQRNNNRVRIRPSSPNLPSNNNSNAHNERRYNKSRMRLMSLSMGQGGGGYCKKFIILCSCLHLMSTTQRNAVVAGESSSPAEERKYLRSTGALSATGGYNNIAIGDENEEEEEEFDYEKFHAKHHIPLPALGGYGTASSSYATREENEDAVMGEKESPPAMIIDDEMADLPMVDEESWSHPTTGEENASSSIGRRKLAVPSSGGSGETKQEEDVNLSNLYEGAFGGDYDPIEEAVSPNSDPSNARRRLAVSSNAEDEVIELTHLIEEEDADIARLQDEESRDKLTISQLSPQLLVKENEEIANLQEEESHDKSIISALLPQLISDSDENEQEMKEKDEEIAELQKKEEEDKKRLTQLLSKVAHQKQQASNSKKDGVILPFPVTEPSLINNVVDDENEEFNYETYHAKHHIPLPAMGAVMGLMHIDEAGSSADHPQHYQEDPLQVSDMLSHIIDQEEDSEDYVSSTLAPNYETEALLTQLITQEDEEIAHLQSDEFQDKTIISKLLPHLIYDSSENEYEMQNTDDEIAKLQKKEADDKERVSKLLSKLGQMGYTDEALSSLTTDSQQLPPEDDPLQDPLLSQIIDHEDKDYVLSTLVPNYETEAMLTQLLEKEDAEIARLHEEEARDKSIISTLLPQLINDGNENEYEMQDKDEEIVKLRKKEQQDKKRLIQLLAKLTQMGQMDSFENQQHYLALLSKLEEKNAPKGILAYAGTNMAMKNFANFDWIVEDEDDIDEYSSSSSDSIPVTYENTLASISKYRYSLLESEEEEGGDEIDNTLSIYDTSTNDMELQIDDSDTTANTDEEGDDYNEALDSEESVADYDESPSQDNTDGSGEHLDRGRHIVGLELREVQPHQQLIIDYQDIVSDYDYNEHEQFMRPLRIRYMLSDNHDSNGDDEDVKNDQLLSLLLDTSFNQTATLWSQALSLPPVMDSITPSISMCGGANIPELDREQGVKNADILVYVSGDNTFCGGAIMHSSICDFDQNMRPLVANINICTKNIPDVTPLPTEVLADYNEYVSTETSRILGASTSLFQHYRNSDTDAPYGTTEAHANCVDGSQESMSLPNVISEDVNPDTGRVYYELRTPRVIEVVRNHFNCMTMTGARMEVKKGGMSCFGGFLDDRIFFGEQFSGFQVVGGAQNKGSTISPLTLAILEDSSWYTANYSVSSEMPFGRGVGCQFAHDGGGTCEVDHNGIRHVKVSSTNGKGFHCTQKGKMGCDVTHSFKARCDLLHFPTDVASSHSSVPSDRSDVCPMNIRDAIDCTQAVVINEDDSSAILRGEVYGESSKCFLTDEGQPMCLKGTCNEEKQGIDITFEDEIFTCTRDGEIIDTNKGARIECPRIAAVCPSLICPSNCSGRGVCDEDRDGRQSCICDDPFDESAGCWGQ